MAGVGNVVPGRGPVVTQQNSKSYGTTAQVVVLVALIVTAPFTINPIGKVVIESIARAGDLLVAVFSAMIF